MLNKLSLRGGALPAGRQAKRRRSNLTDRRDCFVRLRRTRNDDNFVRDNILFLKLIEKTLLRNRVLSPRSEAESLVRHVGRMDRLDFFTGKKTLSPPQKKSIRALLKTRLGGEPLSYLLKEADFCGEKFYVTKATLIPRPETELLVEEALKIIDSMRSFDSASLARGSAQDDSNAAHSPRILDLGTGSGCIAVSLTRQRPDCRMTALDVSSKALEVARKNIRRHGLDKKITLVKSDLFGSFQGERKACWDLLVANPPYVAKEDIPSLPKEVRREPFLALEAGPKGLRVIEAILNQAPSFLAKNAWLLMEIGKGQAGLLKRTIVKNRNYKNLKFVKDFAGIDRILGVQKNG